MRLSVLGAASPELPLRVLNLLAQHGAVVDRALIELDDDSYRLLLDIRPMDAERGALVVEKIRAMVLVIAAEAVADRPAGRRVPVRRQRHHEGSSANP